MTRSSQADSRAFLGGGGEMGRRIREFDWAKTPIGPIESWSPILRATVSIVVASRFPHLLWWGPEYIQIYNDAYIPIPGAKHPDRVLGCPASECWAEIWHVIGPLIDTPFRGGPATWMDDLAVEIHRHGFTEESHFTIAYSPVPDEIAPNGIGGVLATVHEITEKVVGERRLAALRDLGTRTLEAKSAEDVCRNAALALEAYDKDVPFALIYLVDGDGRKARLAGACGVEMGEAVSPAIVDLGDVSQTEWPLAEVWRTGAPRLVEHIGSRFDRVPAGPWSDPPETALVLPIGSSKTHAPAGLMVAGTSSRLKCDEFYRSFLELLAGQVSSAIANARAYEEEKKRAEALAEIDRAKTAFFSNVSHEFRTPLTLILGPVEDGLADAKEPLSPGQRERQELVRRSGLRLQKLVNALLDFSRIEAGREMASYEPVDLASLTQDIASNFRSTIEKGGLNLDVDCPPLPQSVYVDRDMWEKIVLNLVSNAFKFTFDGAVTVGLRPAGERVELVVRDTGIGIAASELPHVFERFHRVANARSRTHEGTGIGLALVQELVRLHGGSIGVESAEGKGSAFTVSIPFGRAHLPGDRVSEVGARPAGMASSYVEEAKRWLPDAGLDALPFLDPGSVAAEETPAGVRRRIVLADDNADMRVYVHHLLGRLYDVEAVADGEAALAAIHDRRPDLVLADVMMPKLDGLELVRALRSDPATRSIPVMLLSARAGEEARTEGYGVGADDYLYKPFRARELLARIASRLEYSTLQSRLSDERIALANLFSLTPIPTAVVRGPDLTFERANPAYIAVVGGRDVIGKPFLEALPEIRGQGFEELLRDVIRTGVPYVGRETPAHLNNTGRMEEFYFDFIFAPIRDVEGAVDCVLMVANDVSARVRSRRELEDADRRKDEFLATLSHELRNPLAPLHHSLLLLRRAEDGDPSTTPLYQMMERQVNQLIRLVDDLLEITRISRGALELHRERVEVATIVRHALETSDPLIRAAGHRLSLSLPRESLWLEGDPVRLTQILANLLNNAAKYTDAGGEIEVAARRDGDSVEISVRDNGVGIASESLPRLFQMFYRGDARQAGHGGLGVGLALSRRLAAMHGGDIEARSKGPGRGSEFIVRLPAAAGPEASDRGPDAAEPERPLRQRVLVVDDNRDAAESLSRVLKMLGADVRVAHDGPEALEAFLAYGPAVVLLDIGMHGMDGYEVARRLRAGSPDHRAALVAMTGWGQEEDRRRAREAGFDHHLTKPADMTALQTLLGSLQTETASEKEAPLTS